MLISLGVSSFDSHAALVPTLRRDPVEGGDGMFKPELKTFEAARIR